MNPEVAETVSSKRVLEVLRVLVFISCHVPYHVERTRSRTEGAGASEIQAYLDKLGDNVKSSSQIADELIMKLLDFKT